MESLGLHAKGYFALLLGARLQWPAQANMTVKSTEKASKGKGKEERESGARH